MIARQMLTNSNDATASHVRASADSKFRKKKSRLHSFKPDI